MWKPRQQNLLYTLENPLNEHKIKFTNADFLIATWNNKHYNLEKN